MNPLLASLRRLISAALILMSPVVFSGVPSKYFSDDALPLAKAIKSGDVDKIASLAQGMDLNQFYHKDMTFLAYAMLVKRHESIPPLIKAGADPLLFTEGLGQPFVIAARAKPKYLEAFLKAGVNPNLRDKWGTPVLFHALRTKTTEQLELFIAYGVDLEIRSEHVQRGALDQGFLRLKYDHVEFLIRHGLDNFLVEDVNGITFAYRFQKRLDQQSKDTTTLAYKKLIEIKSLLQQRGVVFPVVASKKLQKTR